jgi:hypothetical protein
MPETSRNHYSCTAACASACFARHVLELSADGPAEEYCHILATQNDGAGRLLYVSLVLVPLAGWFITCVLWCMCTACCTCWCCCARPGCCGKISTACSRGCYQRWAALVSRCGCGWCVTSLSSSKLSCLHRTLACRQATNEGVMTVELRAAGTICVPQGPAIAA